eukprot:1654414-Pleurochrysis_carterae.AAC.1
MERLQSMPAYGPSGGLATHLLKNYRSHPSLVKLLSRISYKNKLESAAPRDRVECLAAWSKRATNPSFPMLFCNLEGSTEEQEGDSP